MTPGVTVASCSPEPYYYLDLKLSLILLQIVYPGVKDVSMEKQESFELPNEESE